MKKYGRTRRAVLKTIQICRDENILKEYLESREKEVVNIMMTLFDDEYILKTYIAEKEKEATQRAAQKVAQKAAGRLHQKGMPVADIADALSVTEKEDRVTIELMTGEVIDLPKHRQLSITFSQTGEVVVMPGSSRTLSYTIEGGSENSLVKALGQNGWSARVEATSATEGRITITAPDPMTDDEIVVLVYDGQQTTVMSYLCCVQGVVNVANNYYDVPAAGGPVEVPVSTNIN